MHNTLETYLSELTTHLHAMPLKRRAEELREMRQHLLNAVTVNRELGQSDEDAAANAVMQFGTPEDLGENLVWAWEREKKLNKLSFWSAAALALALTFWPGLPTRIAFLAMPLFTRQPLPWQAELWVVLLLMPSYFLCGLACSTVFPRRGLAGTALVEAGLMLLFFSFNFITLLREFPSDPVFTSLLTLEWLCPAMAILGAWSVSRWQKPRLKPLRQAGGL